MTRGLRRHPRLTAVVAGVMVPLTLLLGTLLPTVIERTEAGWTDETVTSAEAHAAVIPAAILTQECDFEPGLLGLRARVEIFWALPEGYTVDDVQVQASTSGLGSVLAPLTGFSVQGSTVTLPDGSFRTDVPANLLGGLLGLGSELEIALVVQDDSGWDSQPVSIASNAGLIGGIGGSCRNLT
ncbi:hypothetical protein [Brachybacterium sacelli]|uniref:Uncharacterized protein n=1 Tax=Brachybacterium sacelli TaxID=173364 RepID=A0ABS4X4E5_9MICO|nr:hypothetical protein [Brachybacterium sacelli]MBP2383108.1 hypothetical protein [Brachybacterium sacelli]